MGWEKKVKVVNLPRLVKKGSVSWSAKPKSTKRGHDSSKTYSDIFPYEGGLPPIGNIILEGSLLPFARTRSNRRPTVGKPKPSIPQPSIDTPPSSRTSNNKRRTSLPSPFNTTERGVCYL